MTPEISANRVTAEDADRIRRERDLSERQLEESIAEGLRCLGPMIVLTGAEIP